MIYNQVPSAEGQRIREGLSQAAELFRLTPELLQAAVRRHTDDEEYLPKSVGLEWIIANPTLFAERIEHPAAFLIREIEDHVAHVGEVVVSYRSVLEQLPRDHRRELIAVALRHTAPRGRNWAQVALQVGMPREFVAGLILQQLRDGKVDLDRSVVGFVEADFLHYGAGRNQYVESLAGLTLQSFDWSIQRYRDLEGALWGVLTDSELEQAMRIVIDKAPNLLFMDDQVNGYWSLHAVLLQRFSAAKVAELLEFAAGRLESTDKVSLDIFAKLPVAVQESVIRRLNGASFYLLLDTALAIGGQRGRQLYEKYAERLMSGPHSSAAHYYTWAQPYLRGCLDQILAMYIGAQLKLRLEAHGFAIGTLTESSYYNKRAGRRLKQFQLRLNGKTYVQTDTAPYGNADHYSPKVGDVVIFEPALGRALNRYTVVVRFQPIDKVSM